MYKKIITMLGVAAISFAVNAANEVDTINSNALKNTVNSIDKVAITALVEKNTRLIVEDIQPSVVTGFTDVFTDQGMFYVSNDGQFLIPGKVYQNINGKGLVDAGDHRLAQIRLDGVKNFENDMIVYPAKDEKHVITVFTDITCGYCRKLHAQMSGYNDLGITVRYLAYPRNGIKDQSGEFTSAFKDLRSIWCSDDPEKALTKAKSGNSTAYRVCDAPIEKQFNFGRQIGVSGTPAIVLENGTLIPGYQEPADLLTSIEKYK